MGRFYPIKRDSTETNKYIEEISVHSSKMTVFYDFAKNKILYAASTPKIGKISDTSVEYTQEEALAKICNLTTNESASIDTLTSWYSSYSVFGFTNKSKHSYRYEKMYFDIISANNDKTVHPSNKIFIEDGDDLYTVRYFHENMFNSHPNRYNDYMYKIDFDFGSNTMKYHTRIVNNGGVFRYNSYSSEQFITADWSKLPNPKAFYLKVSVVDTDLVYYFRWLTGANF